jgi:hypothetical protein
MKSKKNFYMLRFYLNGECFKALSIMKKETTELWQFFEDMHDNEAGGVTYWFRIDIDPTFKKITPYRICRI